MLKGPDLSKWQGKIDFDQLKYSVDFAILRSTYGILSVDEKFYEYAAECRRVGIPILGVYHFCYSRSDAMAEREAIHCMEVIEKAGLSKDTVIFYDLEYDSITNAAKYGVAITNENINNFTIAFCSRVQKEGYRAGVYFNKDYYRNKYKQSTLTPYIKWLADYKQTPTYDCDIQQVTSSESLPGISGNVDFNYLWNDKLLKKEATSANEEEFYEQFKAAMDKYLLELRQQEPSSWSADAREFCENEKLFSSGQWKGLLTREECAQVITNLSKNAGLKFYTQKSE